VEMPAKAEARAAIDGLNGTELKEKPINVNEAPPPRRKSSGQRRWQSFFRIDMPRVYATHNRNLPN